MKTEKIPFKWKMWAVMCFGHLIGMFHRFSMSAISDDLAAEYALSGSMLSNLSSMYLYAYAVMQIPVGILADTVGPRKVTSAGLCLSGAGALLFAFGGNYYVMCLARFLIGMGGSTFLVCILKVLSVWFDQDEFVKGNGYTNFISNFGSILASTPLAYIAYLIGWRSVLGSISLLSLVVSVLIFCTVWELPPEAKTSRSRGGKGDLKQKIIKMFTMKEIWFSFFSLGTVYGVMMSFSSLWTIQYLMHVYHAEKPQASSMALVLTIGVCFGCLTIDYAQKRFKKPTTIITVSAGLYSLLWAYLLLFGGTPPAFSLPVLFFLLGIVPMYVLPLYGYAKSSVPEELTGMVMGFVNVAPFIGAIAGNALFGWSLDQNWQGMLQDGARVYPVSGYWWAYLFYFTLVFITFIWCLFFFRKNDS